MILKWITCGSWFMINVSSHSSGASGAWLMVEADGKQAEAHG